MSILITALSATAGVGGLTTAVLTARVCARRGHRLRTDPLTGLANREALTAAVARIGRRAGDVGLLLADLDGFKAVNDVHGHSEGNLLLQHLAAQLSAVARPGELVVRLHGDEFAILLGALPSGPAGRRTARARAAVFADAFARPFPTARGDVAVTASIGATVQPRGRATASSLLGAADRAMYRRKHAAQQAAPPIPMPRKEAA